MKKNLILGIDPGLKNTGWGVINSFKNKESYLSHGVIKTSSKDNLGERLVSIFRGVSKLTEEYKPSFISVEKIFSNINPESTLKLGKARGIIFLVAAIYKIKITDDNSGFEMTMNDGRGLKVTFNDGNKLQLSEDFVTVIMQMIPNDV